jgi:hypothetical protein
MAVAPIGVPDLSIVTNTLLGLLGNFLNSAGVTTVNLSGSSPDSVRRDVGCQLTLSLFHVIENKFARNSPLLNRRAQAIPNQPMSMDLYYLLTAYCDKDYVQEQQAMTLALQFFYETPIVKTLVSLPGITPLVNEEFILSMEMESSDELARYWQAITVPIRLSVVYKVSIILLTPPATPALAKPVQVSHLVANAALFPFVSSGQVTGTLRAFRFATPLSTTAVPDVVAVDYSPAVVAPGQRFLLTGANLNQGGPAPAPETSDRVYLIVSGNPPLDVTDNWKTHKGLPDEKDFQTDSHITLDLPATVGALPANSPLPGVYQLCAGGNSPANFTNSVPFSIAARIDVSIAPPDPPILAGVGGTYTLQGEGFVAQHTQILLEGIALVENVTGPPADGQFTVGSGQLVTFRAPAGLASGRYTVRVRVNGVESPPSWWILI